MPFIRNPGEFRVDIQRIVLLQIPNGFLIQWNSYSYIAGFYGPNLCLFIRPSQRIPDDLASYYAAPDADRIPKLYGKQFHGDI